MSWDSFALLAVSSVSCAIARAFELEEVLISNLRDYVNPSHQNNHASKKQRMMLSQVTPCTSLLSSTRGLNGVPVNATIKLPS